MSMIRSVLPAICATLCVAVFVPRAHAEYDPPIAYILQIRQLQAGGDREFVLRCQKYWRQLCKQRIKILADGHLQDVDVVALIEPGNVFLKFRTVEGYLRVGSQPFTNVAIGRLSAAHHDAGRQDIILSDPLDGEALGIVRDLRSTKAVATLHIDIRSVR